MQANNTLTLLLMLDSADPNGLNSTSAYPYKDKPKPKNGYKR